MVIPMNLLSSRSTPLALLLTACTSLAPLGVQASIDSSLLPEMDCIVEPSEIVELGSSVPGILNSTLVERNDFVEQGELLAELDSRVERATLELAIARAEMNTSLKLRRENAAFGQRTEKRNKKLFKESTISAQDMDKVKTETYIAQLQAQQEEDNKRIAELEAVRAQQALDQRTIKSPITGVITEKYKSVGEYVEAEPVYRIANLDPLHVELIVPTEHLGSIERGMKAQVRLQLDSHADQSYVAVVRSVDRVADAASGTFGVLLVMPNSGLRIPSGVRCNLSFDTNADTPVLTDSTDTADSVTRSASIDE
jgi:RND family efflux transporter MFP subunit